MWTADMKSNEEWSSQLWSPFLQLRKEAWKKNQDFNGAWTRHLTYISFTGTYEPKLTCSQRQWLRSSVGRAPHRYRKVTGSSPVEVLNFFKASNCKNCDHNCEDHSSFDFMFITSLPSLSGIDFVFVKTIMTIGILHKLMCLGKLKATHRTLWQRGSGH